VAEKAKFRHDVYITTICITTVYITFEWIYNPFHSETIPQQ